MEKKYKMANKNPTVIEGANSSPKMFVLFLYRYRWKGYFARATDLKVA